MPDKFLSQPFIKIAGQNIPEALHDAIQEVMVDTSLYLPEMFTILIEDHDLKWVDDPLFEIGKEVEISAKAGEDLGGQEGLLMKGEITALEPNFSSTGPTTLLVRGYSKSHRLHRGKKSRTFLKQKDSDIVQKIAGEVGLSAQVDPTIIQHEFILQGNQTNMEFLQARAARLNYKVFATHDKLYFKKGDVTLGEGPELKLAEKLRSFRPTLATTHQSNKITVRGWDAKQKQAIVGQANPSEANLKIGYGKNGGAASNIFGQAETVVVDQVVTTVDEAKQLAEGVAYDLGSEFIQAEGSCFGEPKVKAGYTVKISGVGQRFSGTYLVTGATHIINREGYETHFSINGRQPNTVTHLLGLDQNGASQSNGHIFGVVPAIVTNVKDDEGKMARVKVKYDWLGSEIESHWAKLAVPAAGPDRGICWVPEPNDEVLVAFEHGDVNRPYVVGGLWNNLDKPPIAQAELVEGGKIKKRIMKSRSGHIFLLDDSNGKEQIVIRDKTGKNEIIIDSAQNTITVNADKDINVNAGNNISMKATQEFSIQCNQLNIKANSNGNIKATAILNLEGTSGLNAKSTGTTNIEGSLANIKGTGPVVVQGMPIKLN